MLSLKQLIKQCLNYWNAFVQMSTKLYNGRVPKRPQLNTVPHCSCLLHYQYSCILLKLFCISFNTYNLKWQHIISTHVHMKNLHSIKRNLQHAVEQGPPSTSPEARFSPPEYSSKHRMVGAKPYHFSMRQPVFVPCDCRASCQEPLLQMICRWWSSPQHKPLWSSSPKTGCCVLEQ